MWVGVDDTDSPRGGCTTYVLTELVALAARSGLDLLGEPRLVRLNPNIPWKTRGNAALAFRVGHGRGPRVRVGAIDGRAVWSYRRGVAPSPEEAATFREAAWRVVRDAARGGGPGTDPALVTTDRRLPAELYWAAVRTVVSVDRVRAVLSQAGAWSRTAKDPQGLVGATAAIAWAGHHPTWELLAYRSPSRWGTPRTVDAASVRRAQRDHPHLFLCYDARTRRTMVAPHTPCPILFGLRATDASTPLRARRGIRSEPVDRYLLFRTNQGSGDHLRNRDLGPWPPLTSGRVRGRVASAPLGMPGGHVRFELAGPAGTRLPCIAFEPTKTLPTVARALRPGDRVAAWGSRGTDGALRLEGIEVVRWSARGAPRPPTCPRCGRTTSSMGSGRGYRCPSGHGRFPPEAAHPSVRPPPMAAGEYHPTPSARRHLAPLGPER